MRLLALDTSLNACAVAALGRDGPPVVRSEEVDRAHGERLMGMIERVMSEIRLDFTDLERIAVAVGPGSFTGVRVGVAAARGLSLVCGAPVVGIGNLAVHAEAARERAGAVPVLALTRAGRGRVYGQAFAEDGRPVGGARAGEPAAFTNDISDRTVFAGSAAVTVAALAGLGRDRIIHEHASPDMTSLCRLARTEPLSDKPVSPLYLRRPDAKPQTGAALPRR